MVHKSHPEARIHPGAILRWCRRLWRAMPQWRERTSHCRRRTRRRRGHHDHEGL